MPEESLNNQRLYDPVLPLILHSQTTILHNLTLPWKFTKWWYN